MKPKLLSIALIIVTAILTLPARANAQQWTLTVFGGAAVSPSHGFVDLEQTAGDTRPMIGAAVGREWRTLRFEGELAVAPIFFKGTGDLLDTGRLTTMMGTVTWMLPRPRFTARVQPFVSGGIGVVQAKIADVLAAFSSSSTLGAASAGGGILIRVQPRFSVHVDTRYLRSQFNDQSGARFVEEFVTFTRMSGGAVFRF